MGIIKRLPAGIYGNGYRRSLDVDVYKRQSLAGAEFTWKYYAGFYTKDNLPAEALSLIHILHLEASSKISFKGSWKDGYISSFFLR